MNAWQSIIETVIPRIGWTLVHSLWEAVAIAALLALVLRLMRNLSASSRYVAGCAALAATVLSAGVTFAMLGEAPAAEARVDAPSPILVRSPQVERAVATPAPTFKHGSSTIDRENILRCVVFVWIVGVVLMTLRQIGGWASLVSMRRGRTLAELEPVLERLRQRLNIRRAVRLIETARLDVPAVMGAVRPVIFISLGVLNDLTPQQVEAILAHELAHIRRHDYVVNLLQAAIESLMFYHPAVWWISSCIRAEREHCCDDIARSICGDGAVYAAALATLESRRDRAIGSALAPSSGGGDLLARVRRILNLPPTPRRFSVRSLAVAMVALGCLALPLLVHAQQERKQVQATTRATRPSDLNADAALKTQKPFELTAVQKAFPGGDGVAQKVTGYGTVTISTDQLQPGLERVAAVHGPITNPPQLLLFGSHATTGPAATQPAARFDFVNIAVSQAGLLRDGAAIDVPALRQVFEAMPATQRGKTVLAVAAASPQVTVERYFSAIAQLEPLVKEFQLVYLSQTGVMPTTAPATQPVGDAAPVSTLQKQAEAAGAGPNDYYITGAVMHGGVYAIRKDGNVNVKQAIAAAGGLNVGPSMTTVTVIRNDAGHERKVMDGVDVSDLLDQTHGDINLRGGDLVYVHPPRSGEYYMDGYVPRTGVYSLTARKITLRQAIAAAGGLDKKIPDDTIEIIRRMKGKDTSYIKVRYSDIVSGKVEDPFLEVDDVVRVGTTVIAPPATTQAAVMSLEQIAAIDPTMREYLKKRDELAFNLARLGRNTGTASRVYIEQKADLDLQKQRIEQYADEYRKHLRTGDMNPASAPVIPLAQ